MTLDEVERVLGEDVVQRVQNSVREAFVVARSGGSSSAQVALEELLIAMLAAVIEPTKDADRATRCVVLLRQALAAAKTDGAASKH